MESDDEGRKHLLPHHEQQALCKTRLPYRQGRELTAVKVYTINNESNHLLVFGVPSLNLRQEAKALFSKFGRLIQFNISKKHPGESFTETYHAMFERIQSARLAKKMLDTKNFYGGSLHVCYAPELESINETRNKLLQRQKDVIFRLRNLERDSVTEKQNEKEIQEVIVEDSKKKLNMGNVNIINLENNLNNSRKRTKPEVTEGGKIFKPCFVSNEPKIYTNKVTPNEFNIDISDSNINSNSSCDISKNNSNIEIIDFTSTERETITNINESLNYNKFGDEVIRKIPVKPVNKIKFNIGNKS